MTATDPTPLAEQIAREHPMNALGGCVACATGGDRPTIREEVEEYAAHIAAVTEQAVRGRIEELITEVWQTFDLPLPVSTFPPSEQKAYRFGFLWAARIARGGTR
jgi:hypothetical protein